ncbi:probable glycosyltransferase At3g07620 [Punica granatum]|nr:probable glycosyltransferase At3g07620 [Punica granatum]XP_031383088.1 probable glycosyltransferase At3g07620 [Punica granatum]OWM84524.1 hypothetical protein CDL15_Pgr000964 [Punica granatum]
MGSLFRYQTVFQKRNRRWLLAVVAVASTHLMLQSLLLPYGNALRSLLPDRKASVEEDGSFFPGISSSSKSSVARNPLTVVNASEPTKAFVLVGTAKGSGDLNAGDGHHSTIELNADDKSNNVSSLSGFTDSVESLAMGGQGGNLVPEMGGDIALLQTLVRNESLLSDGSAAIDSPVVTSPSNISFVEDPKLNEMGSVGSSNASESAITASKNELLVISSPGKKKMRCDMPPKSVTTIEQMERIYVRNRASSRSMRPRWSSVRDKELLAARKEIENAPIAVGDQELYASLYRNISMFKRSYELMERILRVYVYKEGQKPVFHQAILKGLYASEGWFMKLMEGNKQFVVKDPRRAHLFYMPFSSRMLEYKVYVRNSHNRTNLREYLKQYTDMISRKYPFFNRTGGSDHFLVACHDWAPYETRHHMERCIKALCNADVTQGFKIGRDVSLPETYVRSARNPLRDLGGKPPSKRHILAFYAGNLHGYFRPILLKHWKDKDPDMKIFGPMPPGVASKMNYIQHMKSSKYCICPKGYEVNSPRVVEAIFYECVPVVISDNFVPPFFEVLDWSAFSVILAEKEIPNLKTILASIPEEKYREMQLRVRKVQQHFLWHAKPVKYDLFYMTLHSIWYNRVFQVKPR